MIFWRWVVGSRGLVAVSGGGPVKGVKMAGVREKGFVVVSTVL